MEVFYRVVSLLGGLALFLYGMRVMGDGLKSSSGGAMKAALARVTDRPIKGFILGLLVTCMIQSSTATIVLTVGLVGAGFLKFRQSVGIVFGANVGTAITAQIIRLMDLKTGSISVLNLFKSENLAPIALILGIVCIMFLRKRSAKNTGTILIGFGVLFVGIMNMSSAVSTLSDSLSRLLVAFENRYFLGFLAGTLVTGIIQSSSAVVGILQSLASSVGVRFCGVFAVIIGVNIGDCLTTYLVCRIGAKREQIRTCLIHIIYNVFAASLIVLVIAVLRLTGVLDPIWNRVLDSGGVANVHGLFRLLPAVILLPFSGRFARIAERIAPDRQDDSETSDIEQNLRELDPRLIQNPGLALTESEHLIKHMGDVAIDNYRSSVKQIFEFDENRNRRISERENLLDRMADASNKYIVAISPHITLETDNRNQSFQYRALTCFERIGDLAVNLNDNATALKEAGKSFSQSGQAEMRVATDAVADILTMTTQAFQNHDLELAKRVEPVEEVIDELVNILRERHTERMIRNQCDVFSGIQFQNMLQNLERVSDQCSDLAVYLLGRTDDLINGREHEYIHNLHYSEEPFYLEQFRESREKYFGALETVAEA